MEFLQNYLYHRNFPASYTVTVWGVRAYTGKGHITIATRIGEQKGGAQRYYTLGTLKCGDRAGSPHCTKSNNKRDLQTQHPCYDNHW